MMGRGRFWRDFISALRTFPTIILAFYRASDEKIVVLAVNLHTGTTNVGRMDGNRVFCDEV